jgi:two-component system, OmpR family, phosphate regulon sensor histidine kinase PhoR
MQSSGSRTPRRLVALVLAITVVPLGVFLWLGWRLTQQDRAIEGQQRRERRQLAADKVIAAVDRAISASEQALAAGRTDWPEAAVAVTFADDHIESVPPGRLAYLPVVRAAREVPADAFRDAEAIEFRERDRQAAAGAYRRLSASADDAIRAGALLRLARNLTSLGQEEAALDAYAALQRIDSVTEAGVPVSLAAAWGRCALLAERGRHQETRAEARALIERLRSGRWPVTEAVYATYVADAARWGGFEGPPAPAELLAAAVSRAWKTGPSSPAGFAAQQTRQRFDTDGVPVIVLFDGGPPPRALFVLPAFVEAAWLLPARDLAAANNIGFILPTLQRPSDAGSGKRGGLELSIAASQSGLPWPMVFHDDGVGPDADLAARRRLLAGGFLLLATLSLAASVLILRAVGREMAVAQLQSDFVAAVSHEFRTPLTALRQFTDRLRGQPNLSQELRVQCYEAQARATDRLTKLVESVLDFGRMEAGARPYALGPADCAELVQHVVGDFREAPQAAGRSLTLRRNGSMPVDADEEALSRALWNLLDNAAKYSPEGSDITVDLSAAAGEGRIAVRDRGFGIPAAERHRLFSRFQRGEQARRLGIKGTGIGLAMVDHIVRAHHGRVEVDSELGDGSTFTIVLPLKG